MRDRLIELLKKEQEARCKYTREKIQEMLQGNLRECLRTGFEFSADYLLENGVIVPHCKVGDMVFALWSVPTEAKYVIYSAEVVEIRISGRNCRQTTTFLLEPLAYRGRRKEYRIDDFGKLVFTNKEEAEQALKGGTENG